LSRARVGSRKVFPLPGPLPRRTAGEGDSLKKRDPIPSPSVRRGGGLGWGQALREPTLGSLHRANDGSQNGRPSCDHEMSEIFPRRFANAAVR
jgi:hypothetical protein